MLANIRKVIMKKEDTLKMDTRRREDQKRDTTMKTTRDTRTSTVMNLITLTMKSTERREANMEAQNTGSHQHQVVDTEAVEAAEAMEEVTIKNHFKEAIMCLTVIHFLAWHKFNEK